MATIFTVLFCICSHLELNDQNLYMPYFIILILIENIFSIFQRSMKETGKITLTIWIFTTTWITPLNPGLWLRMEPSVGGILAGTWHKTKPMVDQSSYYSLNFGWFSCSFNKCTLKISLKYIDSKFKVLHSKFQSQKLVEILSLIIFGLIKGCSE